MHLISIMASSTLAVGALGAPPSQDEDVLTVIIPATETVTDTIYPSTTSSCSSILTGPITSPTAPYVVVVSRSDSPIHLLSMNAAGFDFTLGGAPATYCPASVDDCPNSTVTAFTGSGAMDTEVPGGQLVYVAPNGRLGYTQAHSAEYPAGAILAPFIYSKPANSEIGFITTNAFNAPGLMACPNLRGSYQVFAAIANASAPGGNISQCLGFEAVTTDFMGIAAWQYI